MRLACMIIILAATTTLQPTAKPPSGIAVRLSEVKEGEPATTLVQHARSDPEDQVMLTMQDLDMSAMQRAVRQKGGPSGPILIYANVLLNVNYS